MMTVSEAAAVNTVLRYMLGLREEYGPGIDDYGPGIEVASDDAERAAAFLADQAHKKLMAGLASNDVHEAWPYVELEPWLDEPSRPVEDVPTGGLL